MKITIYSAMVILLSGIFCIASAQTPAAGNGSSTSTGPGYTLTLTQPTKNFKVDSPIHVTMTIRNITNKEILWRAIPSTAKDSWYAGFRFLLAKNGKEAETTFFHREISGRQRPGDPNEVMSGSTILLPKPPGMIFVIAVDLKHLYQITEPGQYTLEVSRLAEDGKTFVHSNLVRINVEP